MAESETEGGSKDVTETQQRPESPTVTLTWHESQAKVHKLQQYTPYTLGVPLVDFMYCVLTGMPGESYRRQLMSLLLSLCDGFRALINSLVC